MEQRIHTLLSVELLEEMKVHYQLQGELKKLGDFENFVFEASKEDRAVILRITHDSHRSRAQIESELDWVKYLHHQGIFVPEILGEVVECVAADGSRFFACLFSKVKGQSVAIRSDEFTEPLFDAWGRTMAKIHKASDHYVPSPLVEKRPHWYEDDLLQIERYLPAGEEEMVARTTELLQILSTLETTKEHYNLIHGDIHSGNFFYDGKEIHVFDFDDASYHWLASDLAIPVYYSVFYHGFKDQHERNTFARRFFQAFKRGYETVRTLPPCWQEQLPLMMRLRDITLYSVLHKKVSPEQRNERIQDMMEELKCRVLEGKAIVDLSS